MDGFFFFQLYNINAVFAVLEFKIQPIDLQDLQVIKKLKKLQDQTQMRKRRIMTEWTANDNKLFFYGSFQNYSYMVLHEVQCHTTIFSKHSSAQLFKLKHRLQLLWC